MNAPRWNGDLLASVIDKYTFGSKVLLMNRESVHPACIARMVNQRVLRVGPKSARLDLSQQQEVTQRIQDMLRGRPHDDVIAQYIVTNEVERAEHRNAKPEEKQQLRVAS